MRFLRAASLASVLLLFACQPQAPFRVAMVDGGQLRVLLTNERAPAAILAQAGVNLGAADQLLFDGSPVSRDASLPGAGTLQVRRAISIWINGDSMQTTARTVGEALAQAGTQLRAADSFSLYSGTEITGPLAVHYSPARELTIKVDGKEDKIVSTAATIGAALAEAGFPLLGLDYTRPGENEPLPADGQIQVVRVSESLIFAQKLIPFQSEFKNSADVELGQVQILQPGIPGLAVSRIRIRYEDGQEVARVPENEAVVRPPQDRVAVQGTKIVVRTTTIGGVTFQYWRQMQMYATTYSPCESGTGSCSTGTASGRPAGKGVVAVDPALYAYLNGQQLYIPGYGKAVIGDIGGGYIVEQMTGISRYRWIDLGYNDNAIGNMSGWITVYFLAPAPATIPDILK